MATTTTITSARLLQLALPLIKTHGFTRTALSRAVLDLPRPHSEPLSDLAVTALFGQGDDARRTLVHAWLEDARSRMGPDNGAGTRGGSGTGTSVDAGSGAGAGVGTSAPSMRVVLQARMRMNEPVLEHLPEAFALLATSSSFLPLDPSSVLAHGARVADQACWIAEPYAKEMTWYTRRATVSAIYLAAELHQLTSPTTAMDFLDRLLENSEIAGQGLQEVLLYGSHILDSWRGIAKSRSLL